MDELELIKDAVNGISLPHYVREVKYELDEDWTGDPAVYIYLILADELTQEPGYQDDVLRVNQEVSNAVFASGTDRFPYVRVRTVSEERELAEH